MLDQLAPMWRQFRAEPWRLDILDEIIARVEATQPSSLPDALQDALIRKHLGDLRGKRIYSGLLAMLVELDELSVDQALNYAIVDGRLDPMLVILVAPRLSRDALREALAQVPWSCVPSWHLRELGDLLREAARDGWGAPAVELVHAAAVQVHHTLLAMLFPALAGAERVAVLAELPALLRALGDPLVQVGTVQALLPACRPAEAADLATALEIPDPSDLAAWIRPALDALWSTLDAHDVRSAPQREWSELLRSLAPLLTVDDRCRWLRIVHRIIAGTGNGLSALAVAVPPALWSDALTPLTPTQALEARVWLALGEPEQLLPALRDYLAAHRFPDISLLSAVMARADGPARSLAATTMLAQSDLFIHHEMQACLYLPVADQRERVHRALVDHPYVSGSPNPGFYMDARLLAALAAPLTESGRQRVLRRLLPHLAGWDPDYRARIIARFAVDGPVSDVPADDPTPDREAWSREQLAAALEIRDPVPRWWAILSAIGHTDDAEQIRALFHEIQAGEQALPDELLGLPVRALDAELWPERIVLEAQRPDRAQFAQLLLCWAQSSAEPERLAIVDRALDELTAAGEPAELEDFYYLAPTLDLPRIRRILALVRQDELDEGQGRPLAMLAIRLIELDRRDEAIVCLRRAPTWLAGLLGACMARGATWADNHDILAAIDAQVVGDAALREAVDWARDGVIYSGVDGLRPDVTAGILGLIARIEDDVPRAAALISGLLLHLPFDAPIDEWVATIDAHTTDTTRATCLLTLLGQVQTSPAVAELAASLFAGTDALAQFESPETSDLALTAASHLPIGARADLLRQLLARGNVPTALLVEVLQQDGDDALLAAANRIFDVADVLN